jgi:phosphoribosylanthranilate isomerase
MSGAVHNAGASNNSPIAPRGFVKICGMTDERAVEAALDAGADAIGFVFAPSVRRVSPQQAAQLARPARGRALCVAVTQHPPRDLLDEVFGTFGPDVLQTDALDFQTIALPAGVQGWRVLRGDLAPTPGERVLFEGPRSGTGRTADWSLAGQWAQRCELILAGGLSPDNVLDAVRAVRPFGVDVSSGVEEAPGRKSPARIADFVKTARAAFAGAAQ